MIQRKTKKKLPHVGQGPFDFVNVGLAVAEGRISMGVWFEYLHSFGAQPKKTKR